MKKWIWTAIFALPIGIGGLALANTFGTGVGKATETVGYTCPITGEELPCERCCPLNR